MGISALANMVPQTEPDSQWTAVRFTSTPFGSFFLVVLVVNVPDSSSFGLERPFWTSENWLFGTRRVRKRVLRLEEAECFQIRPASTWPTIAGGGGGGGGGPDGSGHPSDSQGGGAPRDT